MSIFCLKLAIFSKPLLNMTQCAITRPPGHSDTLYLKFSLVVMLTLKMWRRRQSRRRPSHESQDEDGSFGDEDDDDDDNDDDDHQE